MRYMAIGAILALALAISACASKGPGLDCDPCAQAEVALPDGGTGAAAAASGGQEAYNAPFAEDRFRVTPSTNVARGQGAALQASADTERREVASGAAQNVAINVPATANAQASSGGTTLAEQSAERDVASARRSYEMAVCDRSTPDARLAFLAEEWKKAREALSAATAAGRQNITVHYHQDHQKNMLFGISTTKVRAEDTSPEVFTALAAKGEATANSVFSEYEAEAEKVEEAATEDSPSTDLPVGTVIRLPEGVVPVAPESPPSPVVPE